MAVRLRIDGAGRVVIPKALRDALRLEPGDTLEVEREGESLTMRPVRERLPLRKEDGIWVYRQGSPPPADIEGLLAEIREERGKDLLSVAGGKIS